MPADLVESVVSAVRWAAVGASGLQGSGAAHARPRWRRRCAPSDLWAAPGAACAGSGARRRATPAPSARERARTRTAASQPRCIRTTSSCGIPLWACTRLRAAAIFSVVSSRARLATASSHPPRPAAAPRASRATSLLPPGARVAANWARAGEPRSPPVSSGSSRSRTRVRFARASRGSSTFDCC